MSPKRIVLSLAILLGPLACGAQQTQEVSSIGPQNPHPVPPGAVRGPFAQAGSLFVVALDGAVDTFYTPPGTRFTATVTRPLEGLDGRVLVPTGAKVHGTLASVGTTDAPLIRVELESVDTVAGTVPLHAAVRWAQHYDWKGPPTPEPYASYVTSDSFLDYGTETDGPGVSQYGGPAVEGRTLMQPREVRIPKDAVMQLELTEALILPGAWLVK
jgi:hypothetical protein